VAVSAGSPKPDISSVEAFKRTLLNANSIAYSDSANGVYLSTVLFPSLGGAGQTKDQSRMIPAEPAGGVVAKGEAEIGFQQMSEFMPVPGGAIVGPIWRNCRRSPCSRPMRNTVMPRRRSSSFSHRRKPLL